MDKETAIQKMAENLAREPQAFERQLEQLFDNPHFGDVVTSVYPEALDPHNADGRRILKQYSDIANFLKKAEANDEAAFAAIRADTERTGFDSRFKQNRLKAYSIRYYKELRPEHFEAAYDADGNAVGVAIAHPAFVASEGWDTPGVIGEEPYAIVDSRDVSYFPSGKPVELQTPTTFIYAMSHNSFYAKANQLEKELGVGISQIGHMVLEMHGDEIKKRAGREPSTFK